MFRTDVLLQDHIRRATCFGLTRAVFSNACHLSVRVRPRPWFCVCKDSPAVARQRHVAFLHEHAHAREGLVVQRHVAWTQTRGLCECCCLARPSVALGISAAVRVLRLIDRAPRGVVSKSSQCDAAEDQSLCAKPLDLAARRNVNESFTRGFPRQLF